MKKVGLFFGTFNPIHIGHLALAEYFQKYGDLDEVWLVVTPHNPFKKKSNLLLDRERLHLVHLAIEDKKGCAPVILNSACRSQIIPRKHSPTCARNTRNIALASSWVKTTQVIP